MARMARLTTVSIRPEAEKGDVVGGNRRQACEIIDRAARDGSDLVCLPEIFVHCNMSFEDVVENRAEPIPGPTTEFVGDAARRNKCYVVISMLERDGARVYNSAALLGRDGAVVGSYRKVWPTVSEFDRGITPGTETPVFEADFGRVGLSLCSDINYPNVWQGLADNGAQLVCWPSMQPAGFQLETWARMFGYYIMSACPPGAPGQGGRTNWILDMTGRKLAETGYMYPICTAEVNFDREVFHWSHNAHKLEPIRDKYGSGTTVDLMQSELNFALASNMADVTVADIIEEFDLEPRRDFYTRVSAAREVVLRGLRGGSRP